MSHGYSTTISAVGALGSLGAAAAAWAAARATKRAAQGQLLLHFLERDATEEMKTHLRVLRQLADVAAEGFAARWLSDLQAKAEPAKAADAARRAVSTFYYAATKLKAAGALDGARFRVLADLPAADLLLRVVEPMEAQVNPAYDHSAFEAVRAARTTPSTRLRSIPP